MADSPVLKIESDSLVNAKVWLDGVELPLTKLDLSMEVEKPHTVKMTIYCTPDVELPVEIEELVKKEREDV